MLINTAQCLPSKLPNMVLVNTRPEQRGSDLTAALLPFGIKTIDVPLLEISPRILTLPEQTMLKQLNMYEQIIVISPSAAQLGIGYLQQLNIFNSIFDDVNFDDLDTVNTWFAVGKKTATTLNSHNITARVPNCENSEGILKIVSQQSHIKTLIWAGEGGRSLINDVLNNAGQQVDKIAFYHRTPISNVADNWQYKVVKPWLNSEMRKCHIAVLITSEASWNVWYNLFISTQQQLLNYIPYVVVLGDRLKQIIIKTGYTNIIQIESLLPNQIANQLAKINSLN